MTTIAFDPRMGASGDMLLGALIDAGADPKVLDTIEDELALTFDIEPVTSQGIAATSVTVRTQPHDHAEGHGPHRPFTEVVEIVEKMDLLPDVERQAKDAFRLLGGAEAAVHGTSLEETHFHEVGADDAIADVTGTVALLDDLNVDRVVTTALSTGKGTVETSHGTYPIPPPAVAEIGSRSGLHLQGGPVEGELLTPTGAALLGSLAEHIDTLPPIGIDAIGYGVGDTTFASRPNVLRVLVGETEGPLRREDITVLETNVDDVTPEVLGHLQESLSRVGALDVSISPLTMKKSRPGHLVRVVTRPEEEQRVARALAEETGTLGVRSVPRAHRLVADRETQPATIELDGQSFDVQVKIARDLQGDLLDVSAEFEEAARVADAVDRPLREVMRIAESSVAPNTD